MSSAAVHELPLEEDRRSPPVTLAEVLAACEDLEISGAAVTRRSVREKLGRGSMTTIHNGVRQYEGRLASAPPSIDLTQEDRNVIADLGARALAVAEGRVERILAQREAALQSQVAAANTRAEDAIAAAEASIGEAQRHTMEALASSEVARQERDQAFADADEARQHCLRLEGQLTQVAADRQKLAARSAAIEDELVSTKANFVAETALRNRCEADLLASTMDLKTLRSESAIRIAEQVEIISRSRDSLIVEQQRVAGLEGQQIQSDRTIRRLERELQSRDAALAQLQSDLAAARAAVEIRDHMVNELTAALSAKQSETQEYRTVLAAIEQHSRSIKALEVLVISSCRSQQTS